MYACCCVMIHFAEEVPVSGLARNALEVWSFSAGKLAHTSSENCTVTTGHFWCFCGRTTKVRVNFMKMLNFNNFCLGQSSAPKVASAIIMYTDRLEFSQDLEIS